MNFFRHLRGRGGVSWNQTVSQSGRNSDRWESFHLGTGPAGDETCTPLQAWSRRRRRVDEDALTKGTTQGWVRGRLASGDATSQYLRDNFHSFI